MKTVLIYASVHHGNTKQLVDAIAAKYDVDLIDATECREVNLSEYDLIGFASGVYYSKLHQSILNFASVNLPQGKQVFFICTYGGKPVFTSIEDVISNKNAKILGTYSCKGYDTYGPFKLIGGVAKGHPDEEDLKKAVEFVGSLLGQGANS